MSKKSGKKIKWVIPFAVLSVTCAAAGAMAGCNKHTHAYEWKYDVNGTEHWKECPEDGVEEEGTRGEHVFIAGECECGATETSEDKKYGSVTGTVTLHKLGGYDTDFSNVTIDMGDEVDPVLDKATGKFTVENVEVGEIYTLTVSKPGYREYKVSVQVDAENEEAVIGGARGIVLEYEVFGPLIYDAEYHDYSHVNDATPYLVFKENDGTKTLNVLSNDGYTDVSASMRIEYNNSLHNLHTQGIILRFEDGKHLIVRYHNGDQPNGNIQYVNKAWSPCPEANTLFGADAKLDKYGEAPVHTLTAEETAAIKAEDGGLDLTLVLKDGKMTVLFDGKYVSEYQLPAEYADKKVHVGYFAWNTKSNAVFTYGITEELPAMQTSLGVNVTKPEGSDCAVTATPQKDKYAFGEEVELTVTAPEGYMLDALTVNGADRFKDVVNGRLTVICDRAEIAVEATFVTKEEIALNLTVKGKKLGVTSNLAEGTEVTLSGITEKFTVNADGKITADEITKGRYTVSADGYISKEINLTSGLTEIVLEYDSFRTLMNWGTLTVDYSKQNDNEILGATNDCGIILTNDRYDEVAVSITLKGTGFTSGNLSAMFRFVDDNGMSDGYAIRVTGDEKVEVYADTFWEGDTHIARIDGVGWSTLRPLTDAEKELYAKGELKFTVLRKGATFYCFLGNDFIGQRSLPEKYAGLKVEAGFLFNGTNKDEKGWKFEITDDASKFPSMGVTVTDGTAENAHGKITITPADVKAGETVTITVTPDEGYILDTLTVSGGATLVKQKDGTYTFVTVSSAHTVTAVFKDPTVTITNATADGANGTVSYTEGKIVLDDTVEITVTPDSRYMLATIIVTDSKNQPVTLTEKDGKYIFVAKDTSYTLTVTFTEIPANVAEATVTGVDLGNTPVDFEGKTITVKPAEGASFELTVTDGKISRILTAGEYTLSAEGFYDVTVTVGEDGLFEETAVKFLKELFKHNMLGDLGIGDAAKVDYTHAAEDGYLTVKEKTDLYAFTVDRYDNAVFSATFKKQDGLQGLFMAFGKPGDRGQESVGICLENEDGKTKFKFFGNWIWGLRPIAWNKWELGSGENYARPLNSALLAKYETEGIKLSFVRKDGAVYVFIEDELYAVQVLGNFGERDVCFGVWSANAAADYRIPFTVSGKEADVDAMLASATDDNGVRGVLGKWTVTENTVAVTGSGYVEFTHDGAETKESLTLNLKSANSNAGKKAQGILYRFDDGKWIAIRIERAIEANKNEGYIQFSEDALIPTGEGCLKTGWAMAGNRVFTEAELQAFDGEDGLDLTLIRDGRYIHVLLNGALLETVTLDEKYAVMNGVIGATIEEGLGVAYEYTHKTGSEALAGYSVITASVKDGEAHGYSVKTDKLLVKNGESVTLTVETSNTTNAWKYFPNAITVNGVAVDFDTVTRVSLGANRCRYTLTVDNVTADTAFVVTISEGTKVDYDVTVNNAEYGSVVCDMTNDNPDDPLHNLYYWNDLCTWTITAEEGYELEKIVIGDGEDAQEITEGWTGQDGVYTYEYIVSGDVKAVIHFKAVETEE